MEHSLSRRHVRQGDNVSDKGIVVIIAEAGALSTAATGGGCGWVAFFAIIFAIWMCNGLVTGDQQVVAFFNQAVVPFCILPLLIIGILIYALFTRKK